MSAAPGTDCSLAGLLAPDSTDAGPVAVGTTATFALIGQAPIMALLVCLLYPSNLLALPDRQPTRSAQFVFLLVTAALWLGLIDSCREIVKERSIITRELARRSEGTTRRKTDERI